MLETQKPPVARMKALRRLLLMLLVRFFVGEDKSEFKFAPFRAADMMLVSGVEEPSLYEIKTVNILFTNAEPQGFLYQSVCLGTEPRSSVQLDCLRGLYV